MNTLENQARIEPRPEQIEPLLRLSAEGISELVLWLMVEEALRGRLAVFRAKNLPPQPAEGGGKLLV